MNQEDIVEKTEVLISSWEKVRERDKTPGSNIKRRLDEAMLHYRHVEDPESDILKDMYEDSDLMKVASSIALELLWHWINEIRFDGKHSEDLMLVARGAHVTPGKHALQCLALTEGITGIDVMAGAIRHQLGRLWSIAADSVHPVMKEE